MKKYDLGQQAVSKKYDLKAPKLKKIAICGTANQGKSTLIKDMIAGCYKTFETFPVQLILLFHPSSTSHAGTAMPYRHNAFPWLSGFPRQGLPNAA